MRQPGADLGGREPDDAELVDRCKEGDLEAFDLLVGRYQDRVYGYTCRMLGDPETAREITQDVFLRAYRYLGRFRGDAKFSTWLFTIVSSTCKNAQSYYGLRARHSADLSRNTEPGEQGPDGPFEKISDRKHLPEEAVEQRELGNLVKKSLSELPEHYRQVITLKDINDFSYHEIAGIVGCRVGTVKSRLARARLLMRESLTKAGVLGPEGI